MPSRLHRIWTHHEPDCEAVQALVNQLDVQPLTARILAQRNLTDLDDAARFLRPSFDHLHDPMTMRHMDRAVHRTLEAFRDGDPIRVIGDYDVDGVTSSSCIYQFLARLGVKVSYIIPVRTPTSYGFAENHIRQAARDGVRLLITADCGTSAVDELNLAHRLGIDTIVVDHHSLPDELPPVTALLNPQHPECQFPFKSLAAVGVAFNYVLALMRSMREHGAFPNGAPDMTKYLDIVALGTVADVVPLVDVNRVFVSLGLEVLRRRRRPGVSALLERAQVDRQPITARTIGYRIAPLLNAAGRIGDASRCVELLTTDTYRAADALSRELQKDNGERQKREREILGQAILQAEELCASGRNLLLISGEDWHQGVLGVVASRIKERFHRPTAMVAINPHTGLARVSLRSVEGIDLMRAITEVGSALESYGGHTAAAGMTLLADRLPEVGAELERAIAAQTAEAPQPHLDIDAHCQLDELSESFGRELTRLAPFGAGHPEPILGVLNVRGVRTRVVGGRHLRTRLKADDTSREAIGFMLSGLTELFSAPVDVALTPRYISYRGQSKLELLIRDVKRPGAAAGEGVSDDDDLDEETAFD